MVMVMGFNCCNMFRFSFFGFHCVFLLNLSLHLLFQLFVRLLCLCFVSVIELLNDHIAAVVTNHGGKYIDQQIGNHDPMIDGIIIPFLGGGGVFDLDYGRSIRLYLGEE